MLKRETESGTEWNMENVMQCYLPDRCVKQAKIDINAFF